MFRKMKLYIKKDKKDELYPVEVSNWSLIKVYIIMNVIAFIFWVVIGFMAALFDI